MSLIEDDPYGIQREALIKASNVRSIFTPNRPINSVELFMGRKDIVKSVIEGLNTPGQHLLLYGDRGVGKSSLANITVTILDNSDMVDGKLLTKRCSSQDTFETISNELIAEYVDEPFLSEETHITKYKEEAGAKVIGIGAKLGNETQSSKKFIYSSDITPSNIAKLLKDKKGLYLIDEFDILEDDKDKHDLAQLIKLLSDYQSPFKIFIVGISQSGTDLTAGHPSVSRCLKEIKLERMMDKEIKEIIDNGMKKLSIELSEQVKNIIVNICNGYPHFAHLIGLKCAEEAIINNIKKITKGEFVQAVDNAVKDAEGTLKRLYDNATQNASETKQRNIQLILKACSTFNYDDFTINDIATKLKAYGHELSNKTVSDYVRQFTSDNSDSILRRIKRGIYRFNDPRMVSYIKMKENLLERDRLALKHGEI
ncbi:AAA family ATPase [Hydrogenimonas thermophila]|uniref:ATPase family associated with various cellular activities (AAA) n=1 Tax=Hydrogenimonas thermophila TaxID=223786 RepID=A0A1I5V3M7_9BACT|nr:AAA family ATPase [Hydrogenimonas thermophila]SFQ02119.1 ATPase family associated with various cellular activities (AAA) [Hydrogenimonas thermophila]